jgi:hypothetical protein
LSPGFIVDAQYWYPMSRPLLKSLLSDNPMAAIPRFIQVEKDWTKLEYETWSGPPDAPKDSALYWTLALAVLELLSGGGESDSPFIKWKGILECVTGVVHSFCPHVHGVFCRPAER